MRAIAALGIVLVCLCQAQVYAGWRLDLSFTTSSPRGDLKYDPSHVHVVWAEDSAGRFVKTIGRWSVVEYANLTQWMAADGTHLDGWTGATPKAYQSYHVLWDMTDRSGMEVPDGRYRLRFELANHNAEEGQFHRTSIVFDKDSIARSQSFGSRNGYYNIAVNYYFEPTVLAELSAKPASYITSHSARVYGQITDTGGEDPQVTLYWGEQDRGTDAAAWDHAVALGGHAEGSLHSDLTNLDANTTYYYRFLAHNVAGDQWTEQTQRFTTHGPTGVYSGYRVQSGRVQVTGSSLDIDILPVNDMSRAFALISYGTGWQPDTENANVVLARGALLQKDKLRIERSTSARSTWVSWQVIECLNEEFTAYRASGSFTTSQTSADVPLSGPRGRRQGPKNVRVEPANCLAYITADSKSISRDFYHQALLTAYVNSPTTLRVQRGSGGSDAVKYNWVVVEFDPEKLRSVQQGHVNFSHALNASPRRVQIQPVDPSSSLLIYQSRTSVNGLAYSAVAGRLVSPNTVEFYQHQGESGRRDVEFHVIDFGPGAAAQRGHIDFSEEIAWVAGDVELSRPIDLSSSLHFHGLTCNGTGNYFPRPFSTAEFTSDTSLRIERQCPGQPSFIEWQVLQLPSATFRAQVPEISLSADAVTFSSVDVGAHADQAFHIQNTGNADLHINSLEFVGLGAEAYSLVSPPVLPLIVPADTQSEVLTLRFAPGVDQAYGHARLALGSNDPDQPVLELLLNGTGTRSATAAIQSTGAIGGRSHSVALYGDYALLGQGATLTVLDASDPAGLAPISATDLGSIIRDICVSSDVAYVAAEAAGLIPLQITDLAAPRVLPALDTQGHAYAVATADSALCVTTENGLAIFEVSEPAAPSLMAIFETQGPVRAVALSNGKAYALDEQLGLQIIDISTLDQPDWLGSFDELEFGRAIAVQGSLACITDALGRFITLDVQDATAPVLQAQIQATAGAQSLAATPARAFVAAGSAGLELIDISNPGAPVSLGVTPTVDFAADLAIFAAHVYVADNRGGLRVLDVTDAPLEVAAYEVEAAARSVEVSDSLVYAPTSAGGLQVLDLIPTLPAAVLGTLDSLLTGDVHIRQVVLAGNILYVAQGRAGLHMVDVSNPGEPARIGHFATQGDAHAVAVSGFMALLADGAHVYVLDITDPGSPVLTDTWHSLGRACGVAIQGAYGYVANGGLGLQILSLDDLHHVTELGACPSSGTAHTVAVDNQTAFVATGNAGRQLIDVSLPTEPAVLSQFDTPGMALGITVVDAMAYLADGQNGLSIIDVSLPSAPSFVGRSTLPLRAWSTVVSDTQIFIADDKGGLSILSLE